MRILAIETSTVLGGIAIVDDKVLISEIRLNVSVEHSERLLPEIAHLIKASGLSIEDIDAFAISTGPGSFTGLRVGMATAKGLSFASGKPLIAVSTLEAMAWNLPYTHYPVCTVLDARRNQVFMALFKWKEENFITLKEPSVIERNRLPDIVREIVNSERVILIGNGCDFYKERKEFLIPQGHHILPSPANVAFLGLRIAREGRFSDPLTLTPLYLRKSQAEERGTSSL
ncbi:MAG: tRNA (adenosine(37)-N6)-threonylcarbamoyltransferase complex dimerization subunit type 1 TsaB [Thermodesulfovibrionales bacterium]|nr:tRNA (adenosine(37)-N6)-threonylcarbamoyltransferase complex dimerization subunit type 1 TsaB [Thermodesulfovibrionales bacterium]